MNVSHRILAITYSSKTYVDPNVSPTHPFSPNQLTTLGFHIVNPYIDNDGILARKGPMISNKCPQRNTKLGIKFFHRHKNLFSMQSRLRN